MSDGLELAVRAALIGIGATVVIDLWAQFLKRFFGIPSLNWGMVGRWFGHLPSGHFVHENIAQVSPVRGELAIGWIAHYAIGIAFATLVMAIAGLEWARHPTLLPARIFGLVTVAFPFFVMQPGMGAGIAASKTPNPNQARLRSIVTHTIFGIGLYGSLALGAVDPALIAELLSTQLRHRMTVANVGTRNIACLTIHSSRCHSRLG